MYPDDIERLIKYAIIDGKITENERSILVKKALSLGIDKDEFDMVLDARLFELNNKQKKSAKAKSDMHIPRNNAILKCPNCQAEIDAYSTSCEYCGHNVHIRESRQSIQHLFALLNEVESQRKEDPDTILGSIGKVFSAAFSELIGPNRTDRRKMEIISSFPVPTTKADILEFITLAYPRAKKAGNFFTRNSEKNKLHNQFALVWRNKCEQVIMKAKFAMKDDIETLNEVLFYSRELGID